MRKGTSGVWVSESENLIQIGYEDYGVSMFGGGDYECTYTLADDNAVRFKNEIGKICAGKLEKSVKEVFGKNFNDNAFVDFCKKNNIEYSKSTWTSGCWDNDYDED